MLVTDSTKISQYFYVPFVKISLRWVGAAIRYNYSVQYHCIAKLGAVGGKLIWSDAYIFT